MSCWNKEELEQMLEDVVNALDLAEGVIEEHGPGGTPPAELVRLVLEQKDHTIRNLRAMMFKLVEKTSGPWMGRVWRCEEMTQREADERNAKIGVMKWEPC